MKLPFLLGAACALALGASTAQAQNKLTTIFASNNGLSGSSMVFFDVTVTNPVRLTGFELNSYATANSALDLQVYTCATTYVGNETNAAVWTQIAQDNGTAVGAGQDLPSVVPLQSAVLLPAGTYGMALVSNQGHRYTNGNGTNQAYSDNFLSLQLGASASASTPFSSNPITPRVWNGSIVYTPASGIYANFTATPVEGKSPLQVQFTDTTFTDDPAGVAKYEWDFNNDQIVDSTAQNPQFTFTGVGYDVKYTVSLKATDVQNGSSTETKKDFIIVNPFPVASATQFGQGSTVPAGVPGPMQVAPFSSTFTSTLTRGFFFKAPTTFVINSFNVPNEANLPEQSVWFFIYPQATAPSTYSVTAADTKFFATGPSSAPLTPTAPIVVNKDEWVGVLGACHAQGSTSMANSYGSAGSGFNTTVLGAPTVINRLYYQNPLVGGNGTGSVVQSTGSIGRVELSIPGNLQTTIPVLAASGDTPYFGANPTLDMTASIPGAQAGLLAGSLQSLPVSIPTPFGRLLISPSFLITFVVPNGTGSVQLPIPNDPNFADAHIYWQGIVFNLTNNVYGMTNGVDWLIGQQ